VRDPPFFSPRPPGQLRPLLAVVGLVAVFYGLAHLWVTAGESPPSTGPAPAALKPLDPPVGGLPAAGAGHGSGVASPAPVSRPPAPPFREVSDMLSPDRTVGAELGMHGVSPAGVNELVAALGGLFDFRRARAGNRYRFTLRTADARITKFRYETGPLDVWEVERGPDEKLTARKLDIPVRTEVVEIGAELQVSLHQAMKRVGESPGLVSQLVDVFAWDLDFYKDPRPGDTFRVLVEKVYTGDKLIRYGRLLAAEYNSQKLGTFRVYAFTPEARAGKPKPGDLPVTTGYYLEDGQSAKKLFLKTPLKFARVSSKFDLKRKHPILKYTRAHLGVDYAAKTGTPVWSMAAGVVRKAAFERGFGNLVVVDHKNGLLSFYAHLHKFARGLKAGDVVEQKQLVGYVGSTGMSTGPHLHFGVKRNGAWINPENMKMTRDAPVPARSMGAFKKQVAAWKARLAAVPIRTAPPAEPEDDDVTDPQEDDAPAGPPEALNVAPAGPPSARASAAP
jgi:murein DD-endopeptidase MepM/ murein hydrolase activator NlpD